MSSVLGRLHEAVREFHTHGLFLYTWGDANNDYAAYRAQKEAGIGAPPACGRLPAQGPCCGCACACVSGS